jgi:hypothetical protein
MPAMPSRLAPDCTDAEEARSGPSPTAAVRPTGGFQISADVRERLLDAPRPSARIVCYVVRSKASLMSTTEPAFRASTSHPDLTGTPRPSRQMFGYARKFVNY